MRATEKSLQDWIFTTVRWSFSLRDLKFSFMKGIRIFLAKGSPKLPLVPLPQLYTSLFSI